MHPLIKKALDLVITVGAEPVFSNEIKRGSSLKQKLKTMNFKRKTDSFDFPFFPIRY